MIVIITRKTYERVEGLRPHPQRDNPRRLGCDLVILDIPDEIGQQLARIHKHSEAAIEIVLEADAWVLERVEVRS